MVLINIRFIMVIYFMTTQIQNSSIIEGKDQLEALLTQYPELKQSIKIKSGKRGRTSSYKEGYIKKSNLEAFLSNRFYDGSNKGKIQWFKVSEKIVDGSLSITITVDH